MESGKAKHLKVQNAGKETLPKGRKVHRRGDTSLGGWDQTSSTKDNLEWRVPA